MPRTLSEQLQEYRCRTDPDRLRKGIVVIFARYCYDLTIEEILVDPCGKAIPFCSRVREHIGDHSVPDHVILSTALNLRKQAKLPLLRHRSGSSNGR